MISHPKTRLGDTGPEVFPIALGCMGMSSAYGRSRDEDGIATIQAAIERGVTLLDTGDFYGMGHNEMLIRRAIEGRRDKVLLSAAPRRTSFHSSNGWESARRSTACSPAVNSEGKSREREISAISFRAFRRKIAQRTTPWSGRSRPSRPSSG